MSNETGNWEVTTKGLQHNKEDYFIEKESLLRTRDDCYDWPLHLAEKDWVDIEFLLLRFEEALNKHYPDGMDWERFSRSRDEARKIKIDSQRYNAMVEILHGPKSFHFLSLSDMNDIQAALESRH